MTPAEIRRTRGALGLSQAEFGSLLHVAPTTISRWETGNLGTCSPPDMWQTSLLAAFQRCARERPEDIDVAVDAIRRFAWAEALGVLLRKV